MTDPGPARRYQLQAEEFEKLGKNETAADYYKRAARFYMGSGKTYLAKYCLGKHFVRRAFAADEPAVVVELLERGIEAWNIALSAAVPDTQRHVFTLGNIRYIEGVRFSREARLKEILAESAGGREEKIMKLAMASAASLSAAHAKYDSAQLGKKMLNLPVYYNRMGSYHFNRSECYRYLAVIQEILLYIRYGMNLIRDSMREVTTGTEFFDRSYRMAPLPSTGENRKMMLDAASWLDDAFYRLKAKLPFDRQPPDTRGMPKLKFTLTSGLDLMENLYSPMLLILENAGEAWAHDLEFRLSGDFSGEKEVSMEDLPPRSEQLVPLSMSPECPGPLKLKATLTFRSSGGGSYVIEDEKDIPVLSCRQKRGAGCMLIKSSYLEQKRMEKDTAEKNMEKEKMERESMVSPPSIPCPGCERQIDPGSLKCPYCGADVFTRCPQCDTILPPLWDMCPNCGKWNMKKRESSSGVN